MFTFLLPALGPALYFTVAVATAIGGTGVNWAERRNAR